MFCQYPGRGGLGIFFLKLLLIFNYCVLGLSSGNALDLSVHVSFLLEICQCVVPETTVSLPRSKAFSLIGRSASKPGV